MESSLKILETDGTAENGSGNVNLMQLKKPKKAAEELSFHCSISGELAPHS